MCVVRERERVCVCVVKERESVCVVRESVCVVSEREREREREVCVVGRAADVQEEEEARVEEQCAGWVTPPVCWQL